MAMRKIRVWPDSALREVAEPVAQVDNEVRELVRDLWDTMYQENGIGLAATQLAVAKRIVVIDLDPKGESKKDPQLAEDLAACGFSLPTTFINPRITAGDGTVVFEEGCLSVPGISEEVTRRDHVVVEALDENGRSFVLEAHGLFAVAIQHECDHLDGKLFVDYLSKLKRDVIRRKMERLKREQEDEEAPAAPAL